MAVLVGIWLLSGISRGEAGNDTIVIPFIHKILSSVYAVVSVLIIAEFVIPVILGLIVGRLWTMAVPALSLLLAYLLNTILTWNFRALTVSGGLLEFIGVWFWLSLFAALACSGGIFLRHMKTVCYRLYFYFMYSTFHEQVRISMNINKHEFTCLMIGLVTLVVLTSIWLLSGFTFSEAVDNAITVPWIEKALSNGYAIVSVFIITEFIIPLLLGLVTGRRWTMAVPALSLLAAHLINIILTRDFHAFTGGGLIEFIQVWFWLSLFAALACFGGIFLRRKLQQRLKR